MLERKFTGCYQMGWVEKIKRVLGRGHGDVYEATKKYAADRGVAVSDVVASAMTSYLAADEDGKATLEEAMKNRRAGGGGGGDPMAAVEMFTKMANSMSEMFGSVNELRSSVSIGAMVSDFETITTAVEKLKGIGAEKGKGSTEDILADALIRGMVNRMVGVTDTSGKKTKETGTGKVEKIEQ